ncbi:MAG: hypothetical protein Crog4KO_18900 [Crocinitomicaceae bacterium]
MLKILRYFIYVRKSQDRSDRQVMSIRGQIAEIKRLAKMHGYIIVEVFEEQQSAKKPGRPIFNEMIDRLNNGEADGILCWKLNRIARNPVDAGTISWMLQGNVIKAIHSLERSYLPTDNVLMMQIDFGIANQYVKDLSTDVRRGMRDKAREGWNPRSVLPIGYMHSPQTSNDKIQIILDKQRAPIIKELWNKMETGAYSVLDIAKMAERLGLRNKNGNTYVTSTFYKLFKSPMYYGKFYWKDENGENIIWNGKHEPLISEVTFRAVQKIIATRNQNIADVSHFFPYRGLINCGGCKGHVSAARKIQVTCQNCRYKFSIRKNETCPKCAMELSEMKGVHIIDHTYYRCTRNIDRSCKQGSITESKIDAQILDMLSKINIPSDVYAWAKEHIERRYSINTEGNQVLTKSLHKRKDRVNLNLKKLIQMRVSGELSAEEAAQLKSEYLSEIENLETKIFEAENKLEIEKQEVNNYLEFAQDCVDRFKNGDKRVKKEIAAFFAWNFSLFNKSLYFSTKKTPSVLSSVRNLLMPENIAWN